MQGKIKETRIKLDGLFGLTKQLTPSREISLSITKLQESKMWLGKTLQEMNKEDIVNPYPESKNPSNEKIEPTSDTGVLEFPLDYSHIQKVKWLRSEIQNTEDSLRDLLDFRYNFWCSKALLQSIKYSTEAGMWLGMELGRINNSK